MNSNATTNLNTFHLVVQKVVLFFFTRWYNIHITYAVEGAVAVVRTGDVGKSNRVNAHQKTTKNNQVCVDIEEVFVK